MVDDAYIQDAYLRWLTGRTSFPSAEMDVMAVAVLNLSARARKAVQRLPLRSDTPSHIVTVRDLVEGNRLKHCRGDFFQVLADMPNFGIVGLREVSEKLLAYCGRPLHPLHFGED
jgi:hypothetical protein